MRNASWTSDLKKSYYASQKSTIKFFMIDQIPMILVVLVHHGLQMIGVAVDLMVEALQIAGKLKMKRIAKIRK